MATTNLNITLVERRMLKEIDAAQYVGLPSKHFKLCCPARPVEVRPGQILWDKHDLDRWIDDLKTGSEANSHDAILARLA